MPTSTKMPKFVEDAEKKANELWENQYGKTVKPATEGNIEPLEDKISSENKPDDTPKPEGEPQATPEPEPTPEPTPTPEPEPTPTPAPTEDYEHKFNVLQGKYNAEVPAMAYELAQARQEIKELKKPKEEPKVEPKVDLESNEKIKAFNTEYPDVVDAVKLITNIMLDERLGRVDEKISKVEKTVGTVTETFGQNERERFKTDLDTDTDVGKEWRAMNKDPEFIRSLQGNDIYTGRTKNELLQDAWNRMDRAATLQFFKDFKATKPSRPAPTSKVKKDVDPMKIDPPRGGSGGPDVDAIEKGKATATLAEIDKFYKDSAAGLYRGREAEFEKEERRLLKAIGVIKK